MGKSVLEFGRGVWGWKCGKSVGRCVGVWGRCSLEKCGEVCGCGGKVWGEDGVEKRVGV